MLDDVASRLRRRPPSPSPASSASPSSSSEDASLCCGSRIALVFASLARILAVEALGRGDAVARCRADIARVELAAIENDVGVIVGASSVEMCRRREGLFRSHLLIDERLRDRVFSSLISTFASMETLDRESVIDEATPRWF